ncbi:MAG TPA: GntR family transcriptional regulator [Trueperaceae bacterium]
MAVLDTTKATGSGSLQDVAREAIKERILLGELPAGSPLSEEGLARELNMSRTPVRHALQDLVAQGLLERTPGRGAVVRRIDIKKMLDIIDVQECLLVWCVPRLCDLPDVDLSAVKDAYAKQLAGLASGDNRAVLLESRRMDTHLVGLTGNQEMVRYMREISDLLVHAASQMVSSREKLTQAVSEHGEIIDAIEARDKRRAREAIEVHLAGVKRRFLGLVE